MGIDYYKFERVLYYYNDNGYIYNIVIESLGYDYYQYLLFMKDNYVVSNGRIITKERILFDLSNMVKYRKKYPIFNNIKGLTSNVIDQLLVNYNINSVELKEVLLHD